MPAVGQEDFERPASWDMCSDDGHFARNVDLGKAMLILARRLYKATIGLDDPTIEILVSGTRH